MALTKELFQNMYTILAYALKGDEEAFRDLMRLWELEPTYSGYICEDRVLGNCLAEIYFSDKVPVRWKKKIWRLRYNDVYSYEDEYYAGKDELGNDMIGKHTEHYHFEHFVYWIHGIRLEKPA